MIVNREFYKNSNTGELVSKSYYTETLIDFPDYYYDVHGKDCGTPDLTGFVKMSEKKFIRERKKQLR